MSWTSSVSIFPAQPPQHVAVEGHHRRLPRGGEVSRRLRSRLPTSGSCSGIPRSLEDLRMLELDVHTQARPARLDSTSRRSSSSSRVRTPTCPSYLALAGRLRGQRSRARSCTDLGEVEVLHEPAVLLTSPSTTIRATPVGEGRPSGHVGCRGEVEIVTADEHPVPGAHHVGLDRVSAAAPREPVGQRRVLGAVPARTPVRAR